jgi:DNA-binding response OmpR family regulator
VETTSKVLVVEDDDAIRALLVAALRREPFDVHSVTNGAEALAVTRDTEYTVILVDLMMPEVSGVEFLEIFHQQHPDSRTVIFLMTAFDDVIIRRLPRTLIHGIIRKPFDVPQLVTMVREVVAVRRDPADAGTAKNTAAADAAHEDAPLPPDAPN